MSDLIVRQPGDISGLPFYLKSGVHSGTDVREDSIHRPLSLSLGYVTNLGVHSTRGTTDRRWGCVLVAVMHGRRHGRLVFSSEGVSPT
jgi:hypothetical protein